MSELPTRETALRMRSFRERYRALRGLFIHVVRRPMRGLPGGVICRNPAQGAADRQPEKGRCSWCRLPVKVKGRDRWHPDCVAYYALANGSHHWGWADLVSMRFPRTDEVIRSLNRCPCGADGHELDHTLAIGVAQALAGPLDRRVYALAFTLENLRWLCHDCHSQKSGMDRRWMNDLAAVEEHPTLVRPREYDELKLSFR